MCSNNKIKIKNFPKKPNNGGNPAKFKNKIINPLYVYISLIKILKLVIETIVSSFIVNINKKKHNNEKK